MELQLWMCKYAKTYEYDEERTVIHIWFKLFLRILRPILQLAVPLVISPPLPPRTDDDNVDVQHIQADKSHSFNRRKSAIPQCDQDHADRERKEAHVAQELPPPDLEGLDDAHGANHTRNDEGCCTQEFSNCQAPRVGAHGRERGEDIGTPVSKR